MSFTNSHPFACRVYATAKARLWCEENLNVEDYEIGISLPYSVHLDDNGEWVVGSMFNFRYEADLLVFRLANGI